MQSYSVSFSSGTVAYYPDSSLNELPQVAATQQTILLVDEKVLSAYGDKLKLYKTIPMHSGESHKTLQTAETIIKDLIRQEVQRNSMLIGVGGGVVTDITGFIASTYMRGTRVGFVPTTLLGMIDAAIGGKNGVNIGLHKNMMGTIRQPEFILYDTSLLGTLQDTEWSNGFAEIIKYALLFDAQLFEELNTHNIDHYQQNKAALQLLIARCVALKNKIVQADEQEKDERKLLNFGHTAGHALENMYHLPHGHAVGLGMIVACDLSINTKSLNPDIKQQLIGLLKRYHLPTHLEINPKEVMQVLVMDKKRQTNVIDYILLNGVGNAVIQRLSFDTIQRSLETFAHGSHH